MHGPTLGRAHSTLVSLVVSETGEVMGRLGRCLGPPTPARSRPCEGARTESLVPRWGDLGASTDARRNPRPQGRSIGSLPRPNHSGRSTCRVGPVNSGTLHGLRAGPESRSLSDPRSTEGAKTPAPGRADVLVVSVRGPRVPRWRVLHRSVRRRLAAPEFRIARPRPEGVFPRKPKSLPFRASPYLRPVLGPEGSAIAASARSPNPDLRGMRSQGPERLRRTATVDGTPEVRHRRSELGMRIHAHLSSIRLLTNVMSSYVVQSTSCFK